MSHFIARRGLTLVEVFVVIVVIGFLLCLLLPALVNTGGREAARRAACINTMKQLGLALHNYHDRYKCFPASSSQPLLGATAPVPGSSNADGNGAGYSWQTMILPFVEENNLYQKLNVVDGHPYDGSAEHNLVAAMPVSAFRCPSFNGGEFAQAPEYPKDSSALGNYVAIGATHLASLYGTETRPIGGKNHPNGVLYPGSKTCVPRRPGRHFQHLCPRGDPRRELLGLDRRHHGGGGRTAGKLAAQIHARSDRQVLRRRRGYEDARSIGAMKRNARQDTISRPIYTRAAEIGSTAPAATTPAWSTICSATRACGASRTTSTRRSTCT